MPLQLHWVGSCDVRVAGVSVKGFAKTKAAALLAYLSVEHDRDHRREALATLLWPDHDTELGRQNLRQLIATIRRELGSVDTILRADRYTVRFMTDATVEVDAHVFEHSTEDADDRIASAYRGPFLATLSPIASEQWNEWLNTKRQRYEHLATESLRRILGRQIGTGAVGAAVASAQRLLSIDPWSEDGHRGLMRALALSGKRNAALAHYHKCRTMLAAELGIAPESQTVELFEAIRGGLVQPVAVSAPAAALERRQVSALYVQPFVPFATDPEDEAPLPEGLALLVERHGGSVAPGSDGGLLAYFASSDNTARQAIETGMDALAGSPNLRAAVHTGTALVDKGQGNPVQGNVGRLARALVETAEAGCLLADDASVRLASVHFRWREVALPDLPAFGKGLRAHEAVAATEAGKGFQATDAHRSPLVGRDEALDRLERGWARVRAGRTAAFVVAGEPGIGKSRLVHELTERIGGEAEIHRHDCMPQYANVPFRPLTAVIEDSLGIAPSASTEDRARAATAAAASQSDPAAAVALRLLLGLPVPPHAVPPSVLQQSMRRIVLDLIRRKARRRPLVLTIEDIHWCDQPTLRILADLSLPGTDAAVLVLASVRPGDAENSIPAAERIVLAPLDPKDAARLAEAVLEDATVPEAVVDAIVRRAAGVPLFVEELALASRGGEPVIPGNIKELMLARLDRIPSGKAAAVLGATIGNAFPLELLRQAAAHLGNPDDVVRGLGALVEGGILESGRDDSRTIYRFRHGLLQEAIYDAQPRRDRRRRHNAVVSVLEAGSLKGWTAHQPAVLAWHLQGAGREAEALTWWIAAAEDAVAKGAHVDALGHGMRGLVVLEGLAEDPATLAAEIRLRLTMAAAAASSLGLGNRQSEAHYARALLLVRRLPASLPSFSVLWGHYTVTSLRWRWIEATEAASHLLAAADALKDDRAVGMANFAAGHAAFFTGRMVAARPHLARAAAAPEDSVRTLPFDYRPYALALQASADWLLGTDDDPAEMCDRALAMAARGRPIDLGPPLTTTAYLQFLRGDYGAVATLNDRLVDLCDKGGLVMWKALALLNRALLAGSEAGLADVDQALALWDAAEAGPPTPTPLLLAAAARLRAGRWEEAAATAEEVLTQAEATGGLWFRPKALTMLGDALRALGRREDACGAYGRAVEEARAMGLVQFEREAATLLSSL